VKNSSLAKFAVCAVSCLGAATQGARVLADDVSPSTVGSYQDANFRMSFELKTPRRFASRFKKATRTLEVRVTPAQAREFEASTFYDTRIIHRLVLREEAGEVILGFQLKNENMGWLVTYQENPWRLVVDLWRTDGTRSKPLEEQWQWQTDSTGEQKLQSNKREMLRDTPREMDLPATAATETAIAVRIPLLKPDKTSQKGYGRVEEIVHFSNERIDEFQRKAGEAIGSPEEYSHVENLAAALYLSGRSEPAVASFRRLASLSEAKFRNNPENLWRAGEAAFLSGRFALSRDYLRTLLAIYPDTAAASGARLRLADMDIIESGPQLERAKSDKIAVTYADIALHEKSAPFAKIASTLRILKDKVDANPESATLYQHNLTACVAKQIVPFEMRKDCAYIKTRSIIEKVDINSADREVQDFKKFASQDPRWHTLDARITARVKDLIIQCQQQKTWDTWIEFEQQARPQLLDFTRADASLLTTRASAWEAAGNMKNAAKLFGLAWDNANNGKSKDNAASRAALILHKSGKAQAATKYLRALEKSTARKSEGFSSETNEALRALAQPPYRSKKALDILVHEMAASRFVERDLESLLGYAKLIRGSKNVDIVYEKILAHPAQNADEAKNIEAALFQYSDELGRAGKNQKSAEILAAVANLQSGTRRAEAAYRAGISYARAGQLEKAKNSWQLAASDISDKRFSTLANERLDRIR
jgi:hypothetical protein